MKIIEMIDCKAFYFKSYDNYWFEVTSGREARSYWMVGFLGMVVLKKVGVMSVKIFAVLSAIVGLIEGIVLLPLKNPMILSE